MNQRSSGRNEGRPPAEGKQETPVLSAADSTPYPPIRVQGPSPVCARAMLENIGGRRSEMTALGLYLYGGTLLREKDAGLSACLHQIAVVEMHHLDIFCRLAQLLGADPRLWGPGNGRITYWSPSCIPYTRSAPALLRRALALENQAVTEYRRQAVRLPDPSVRDMLERILLDEEKHVELLRSLIQDREAHL